MAPRLESSFKRYRERGDTEALGRVFDATASDLYGLARRLVGDSQLAEDIVQQTYVTAIEKASSFDGGRRLFPWLAGILARHAASARSSRRRTPDPRRVTEREEALRKSVDPVLAAERTEIDAAIALQIDALPATYASAVKPLLVDGARPADIGRALGISANAVSIRLHRGLGILRSRLPQGAAPALALSAGDLSLLRGKVLSASSQASAGGTAIASAELGAAVGSKALVFAAIGAVIGSAATHGVHLGLQPEPVAQTSTAGIHIPLVDVSPTAKRDKSAITRLNGAGGRVAAISPGVSEPERAPGADVWLERVRACTDKLEAQAVFSEIAALAPAEGLGIMERIWSGIEVQEYRMAAIQVFFANEHDLTHRVLHLGATDTSILCQSDALRFLTGIAFVTFAEDVSAYERWSHASWGMTYAEVLTESARDFAGRASASTGDELFRLFSEFERQAGFIDKAAGVDVIALQVEGGLMDALTRLLRLPRDGAATLAIHWARKLDRLLPTQEELESWMNSDDPERRAQAMDLLERLGPREEFINGPALDILRDWKNQDVRVLHAALDLFDEAGNDEALEILLSMLADPSFLGSVSRSTYGMIGRALASIGDPRAIPPMIALIRADNTYDTVYYIGYFGLTPLTGVDYDESHDGPWWETWWMANRVRLPEPARSMSLPYVEPRH